MKNGSKKRKRNWIKGAATAVLCLSVLIAGILIHAVNISAKEQKQPMYYTAVCIQSGDTLWGIAQRYSKDAGMSVREYFDKLKEINQISGGSLQEGNYLTIAYSKGDRRTAP